MANASVEWQLSLIDKVTGPARRILERVERLERRFRAVDRATEKLGEKQEQAGKKGSRAAELMERGYGRLEGRLKSINSRAAEMTDNLLKASSAAVTLGAGLALKSAVSGMATRESNLTSLGILLKTQDPAQIKSAANWVGQFADNTPFADNDVMDAVKRLLGAQFSFEETKWIARITGDAAAVGSNSVWEATEKWTSINRALGQIKAKGKLQGDELEQLADAGVHAVPFLDKYVGKHWRQLAEKGQLGATQALNAIFKGMYEQSGGAMDKMSKDFRGMTSTLLSRPQRLFDQMYDQGGLSKPKAFLQNLLDLTDFNKSPGDQILKRLSGAGTRIMDAIFGPLADATSGSQGEKTVGRLLDKADEFATWVETYGPDIVKNLRGFAEGFTSVASGVGMVVGPLSRLLQLGDGAGGKLLGMLLGGTVLARSLNLMTFGLGGKALRSGGGWLWERALQKATGRPLTPRLPGGLFQGADGQWHMPNGKYASREAVASARARAAARAARMDRLKGWGGRLLGRFRGLRGGGLLQRAGGLLTRVLPWVARIVPMVLGLNPVVLGITAAVLALGNLGVYLYRTSKPFRDWIDGVGAKLKGWSRAALDFSRGLWDGLRRQWDNLPHVVKVALGVMFPPLGAAMALADAAAEVSAAPTAATPEIQTDAPKLFVPGMTFGTAAGGSAVGGAVSAPVTITNHFNVAGSMDGQAVADIGDKFSTLALEGGVGS